MLDSQSCILYTLVVYILIFCIWWRSMEAKELKKLSRSELLEMLLDRSKEVEHLRKELNETKKHIATLEREVEKSGDINAAIQKLNSATEQIQKFASVISLASNNLANRE